MSQAFVCVKCGKPASKTIHRIALGVETETYYCKDHGE